ncbi:hypothetical protein J1N35_041190 [Gossypium stocksii]|uniref:Uncharacterized protein n=1 Tax=Gossypium stocksii TaxID=47602 RepID=A0A9D3ZJ21_9ROSI|nr:hypothetical protein J1N35_041190 [Gossypium stocksii]
MSTSNMIEASSRIKELEYYPQLNDRTCHLPITSIVKETCFRLAELFPKRAASYVGQLQGGHVCCSIVLKQINNGKARVDCMVAVCHLCNDLWFRVMEFDRLDQGIARGVYRVHLRNKTCNCGIFDALHFPYVHAIVGCMNYCLDPMSFVNEVYKLENLYNVWRHVLPLVPDECK